MPTSPQSEFSPPLFFGIDVGGTNIKVGIVDDLGQVVCDTKFPTQPDQSPSVAFAEAKVVLDQLIDESDFSWDDIVAGGLGTPGPMDVNSGTILTPSNLPGWHQYPVRDELSRITGKPVTFSNDAGAAAFGEFWVGSGQQYNSLVLFTLGTGVGGGIIVDEMSIDGVHSHGAEVGHITIDSSSDARVCGCGHTGHLEAYASATALVDRTREAMSANNGKARDSILQQQIGETSPLSALMISQAASNGDQLAIEMIEKTAAYLGRGVAQLAHIIDPEVFIMGGAMDFGGANSEQGQKFLDDIKAAARKLVFPVLAQNLTVSFAELGSTAGFVGAAGLARQEYGKKVATG